MEDEYSAHGGACYLKPATILASRRVIVDLIVLCIRFLKLDFDTVVVCGISGCLIGPMLASKLNKRLLVIRKKDDGSHSSCLGEGNFAIRKYIIIDDLVSSGTTINYIMDSVRTISRSCVSTEATCQCIFCYHTVFKGSFQFGSFRFVSFNWSDLCNKIVNFCQRQLNSDTQFDIDQYSMKKLKSWFGKVCKLILKETMPS